MIDPRIKHLVNESLEDFQFEVENKLSQFALHQLKLREEKQQELDVEDQDTEETQDAEEQKSEIEKNDAEAEKIKAETEKAEADAEDITLDPNFQKEFFLDTFEYKGKVITLKKIGTGNNVPVSAYVDGKRTEVFLTMKQAMKGIKNIIDLKDKTNKNDVKEATIENLKTAGRDGVTLKHLDESMTHFTNNDVNDVLKIYNNLNRENKESFQKEFMSSQDDAVNMIHFFQERLKRDLV